LKTSEVTAARAIRPLYSDIGMCLRYRWGNSSWLNCSDLGPLSWHNPPVRRHFSLALALLALFTISEVSVGVASATASPKDTILLIGDGVGTVRFGETQSAAAASLEKLIGKSDGGVQKANMGDYIISAALYWQTSPRTSITASSMGIRPATM